MLVSTGAFPVTVTMLLEGVVREVDNVCRGVMHELMGSTAGVSMSRSAPRLLPIAAASTSDSDASIRSSYRDAGDAIPSVLLALESFAGHVVCVRIREPPFNQHVCSI